MAEDKLKRISYQPKDYNEVKQVDELKAHEILLKYEDNDIVITDENCNPHSLKEFINSKVKNLLSTDHMKDNNQHNIATKDNDGFLSSEMYKAILSMEESVKYILDILNANAKHNPFITDYFDYSLKDNILLINSLSVNNGVRNYSLTDETMKLVGGINTYPTTSLVYLNITDNGFTLEKSNTIFFSDIFITIGDDSYIYDKKIFVYTNGEKIIYPLLVITNNHTLLKDCDEVLFSDLVDVNIYKFDNISLNTKKEYGLYELLTNVTKTLSNKVFLYAGMNGNDTDIKSGNEFNRNIKYKTSPYGKMGYGTSQPSDIISFADRSSFFLSFMIDTDEIVNETVIKITDDTFTKYIDCSFNPNDKTIVVSLNGDKIYATIKRIRKYSTISINVSETELVILQDNEEIISKDVTNKNKFNKIQLVNNKMPIGQILLADEVINDDNIIQYKNNEDGMLIGSFDVLSNNDLFSRVEKSMTIATAGSNLYISSLSNYTKLSKGDVLRLSLDDKCVPFYNSNTKIISVDNDIIYTDLQKFMKVGKNIVIYNDNLSKYYNVNITEVGENFIIIDRIISDDIIGLNISDSEDVRYAELYINGNLMTNMVHVDDYNFDIYVDKDYDISSKIDIVYYKKINNNCDFEPIHDIAEVCVNDNMTDSLLEFKKEYQLKDLSCKYNDVLIDNSVFEKNEHIAFSNDKKVKLDISFNVNDSLIFQNVDMNVVRNYLNISAICEIWTGSNPFSINGIQYQGNSQISTKVELKDLVCDYNGLVTISIETESGQYKSKIILDDFKVSLFFKDMKKIFFNKDGYGRMNNITVYGKDYILSDVKEKLSIITVRKYDSEPEYCDYSNAKILGDYDDKFIIKDYNNLIKLAKPTDFVGEDGLQRLVCYNLEKKFIL